jgi:NAD+ kinase
LIGKYPTAQGGTPAEVLREVAHTIEGQNCKVLLDEMTAQHSGLSAWPVRSLEEIGQQADLAVVVGGDGTMLATARQLARYDVPLIGINQGRLGFITDIALADQAQLLPPMLRGDYAEDLRTMLAVRVEREGQLIFQTTAMNDVVVNRGSRSGLLELRVEIDGHFVANYRGDGLIVSTPTGSTAYSLSAGGPLLHPSLGGFCLVPIAPINLSNRPLALAHTASMVLEVIAGREASANFDMQSLANLQHGDRVLLERAEQSARLLHPQGWSYYDTLREKLFWNQHNCV